MIVTTVTKRNEKSKEQWNTNSLFDSSIASFTNMVNNGVDLQSEVWETENDGEKEGKCEGTEREADQREYRREIDTRASN